MRYFHTFLRNINDIQKEAYDGTYLYFILIGALFLESYMHNLNIGYILLFFLISSVFLSFFVGISNISELETRFVGCGRVFVNKEGNCRFEIFNNSTNKAWNIDLVCKDSFVQLEPIKPYSKTDVILKIFPKKRGEIDIGHCFLKSFFPLGIFIFKKSVCKKNKIVVYPEPKGISLELFLYSKNSNFGLEEDFDLLKPYTGTENVSRIHWPSIAKGEILVKKFEMKSFEKTLYFDFLKSGKNDEERLSQITLWVLECEKNSYPFTIKLLNEVIDSKKYSIDEILTKLAKWKRYE